MSLTISKSLHRYYQESSTLLPRVFNVTTKSLHSRVQIFCKACQAKVYNKALGHILAVFKQGRNKNLISMPINQFMTSHIDIKLTVDTCGTRCPIPILRTKTALKQLQIGDYLKVLATDPAAKPDFDAMLRHLPHELVSFEQLEPNQQLEPIQQQADEEKPRTVYSFTIRKG